MLDAVTFDLGSTHPPIFVFPDASGLAPLTLPDEFLRGQSHQPQPEVPSDAVRRFEAAMSAKPQLPPSVVEKLMANLNPESPKIAGQEVESPKATRPTVEVPEVESPKVKSPAGEGLKIQSPKPEVASGVDPVPVASVERTRPAEPAVVIETAPVKPAERPTVATGATSVHEGSVARLVDEKPVAVAPAAAPTIAPAVLEKPDRPVEVEDQPVVAGNTLIAPAAPSAKPVEIEVPVAVGKPIVATVEPIVVTVEPPVRAAVGESEVISANATIPADPVVRPVEEEPVVGSIEQPKVQVVTQPTETAVVVETAPVKPAERPTSATVERPVVVSGDQPVVSVVEPPKVVTVERPVTVNPPSESAVAPTVLENPVNRVDAEERPVAAGDTLVAPAAPSAKPVEIVERPVAVDKPPVATVEPPVATVEPVVATVEPIAASVEPSVRVAVGEPEVASANATIPADPVVRSANEGPVFASPEQPKVQVVAGPAETAPAVEKAPAGPAEKPVAAKVSHPAVGAVDKPEEKAVAAAAHVVVAPPSVEPSAPQVLQAAPEVAAASAASARTEVLVEAVNRIVEAVVGQMLVTPGITHGEGEIKILLKPTVLDGSEIAMSAKDGTLAVSITPATQAAAAVAAAALPRLEIALAEHAPAFYHVSVALQLKKGNRNEAV